MKSSIRGWAAVLAIAVVVAGATACGDPEKQMKSDMRAKSHLALARRLLEQRRQPEALAQADMALAENKKNPDAWLVRGQVHFSMGDYLLAIEDFSTAMGLRESFTEARSWRAWARFQSGDAAGAESDYRAALLDRLYPSPEKIHLNLALLLLQVGREGEAIEELKAAVARNPAYARGHYELGKLQDKNGNLGGAIVSYQAALGGMKDSVDLNLRLGVALEAKGEGARAKEYLKRVVELSPDGPEAARARETLKKIESAPS